MYDSCKDSASRIKRVLKSFKNEIGNVPDDSKEKYSTKYKQYKDQYQDLTQVMKRLGVVAERDQLMSGAKAGAGAGKPKNTDDTLRGAAGTAAKTTERLHHTLQTINAATEVGTATGAKMVEQTEQIGRVKTKVRQIDEDLSRADKLISRFMRRMYTDKIILAFTCLVVAAIAGIIAYSVIEPDQTTFSVPDAAKPDPNAIKGDIESATSNLRGRRMLAGALDAAHGVVGIARAHAHSVMR